MRLIETQITLHKLISVLLFGEIHTEIIDRKINLKGILLVDIIFLKQIKKNKLSVVLEIWDKIMILNTIACFNDPVRIPSQRSYLS